ncbi:MAG: hypothetical protein V4674_01825 [Patescibacteria group bacterium]
MAKSRRELSAVDSEMQDIENQIKAGEAQAAALKESPSALEKTAEGKAELLEQIEQNHELRARTESTVKGSLEQSVGRVEAAGATPEQLARANESKEKTVAGVETAGVELGDTSSKALESTKEAEKPRPSESLSDTPILGEVPPIDLSEKAGTITPAQRERIEKLRAQREMADFQLKRDLAANKFGANIDINLRPTPLDSGRPARKEIAAEERPSVNLRATPLPGQEVPAAWKENPEQYKAEKAELERQIANRKEWDNDIKARKEAEAAKSKAALEENERLLAAAGAEFDALHEKYKTEGKLEGDEKIKPAVNLRATPLPKEAVDPAKKITKKSPVLDPNRPSWEDEGVLKGKPTETPPETRGEDPEIARLMTEAKARQAEEEQKGAVPPGSNAVAETARLAMESDPANAGIEIEPEDDVQTIEQFRAKYYKKREGSNMATDAELEKLAKDSAEQLAKGKTVEIDPREIKKMREKMGAQEKEAALVRLAALEKEVAGLNIDERLAKAETMTDAEKAALIKEVGADGLTWYEKLGGSAKQYLEASLDGAKRRLVGEFRRSPIVQKLDSLHVGYHQWFVDRSGGKVAKYDQEFKNSELTLGKYAKVRDIQIGLFEKIKEKSGGIISGKAAEQHHRALAQIERKIEKEQANKDFLRTKLEAHRDSLNRYEANRNKVCEKVIGEYDTIMKPFVEKRDALMEKKKELTLTIEGAKAKHKEFAEILHEYESVGLKGDATATIREKLKEYSKEIKSAEGDMYKIDHGTFGGPFGRFGGLENANSHIQYWDSYKNIYKRSSNREQTDVKVKAPEKVDDVKPLRKRKTREYPDENDVSASEATSENDEGPTAPEDAESTAGETVPETAPRTEGPTFETSGLSPEEIREVKLTALMSPNNAPFNAFLEKANVTNRYGETLSLKRIAPYMKAVVLLDDALKNNLAEKAVEYVGTIQTEGEKAGIKDIKNWESTFGLILKTYLEQEKVTGGPKSGIEESEIKEISKRFAKLVRKGKLTGRNQ